MIDVKVADGALTVTLTGWDAWLFDIRHIHWELIVPLERVRQRPRW
ncbi:MAG: hypothetical protein ACYDH5_09840 [Acidimicrobiales bacterium]